MYYRFLRFGLFLLFCLTVTAAWTQGFDALAASPAVKSGGQTPDADKQALLKASELYDVQKYEQAAALLGPLAEKGNAAAAFSLGLMEARGNLGAPDYLKARQWWELAAKQSHPEAEYNLGLVYARGVQDGGEKPQSKDYGKAREWLERAAGHGHGGAMYALAGMARVGEGQAKNPAEAAKWYQRAAEIGHPDAQYQLGSMYLNGSGVEKNPQEARKWMQLAADAGHPGAKNVLKLLDGQARK